MSRNSSGRLAALPALGRLGVDILRGTSIRDVARELPGGALRAGAGAARRTGRVASRSSTVVLTLFALSLGLGLGLASAEWATRGRYPFGGISTPPWTAWPRVGGRADPYARAINARRGDIPLAVGEGVSLTADADEAGRPLDPACTYRISGDTPPARLWTLTAYDGLGDPASSPLERSGFTSSEVLREANGRFTIMLSREVQSGNWLAMPTRPGAVALSLRLYDTPVGASAGAIDPRSVPRIERVACDA